MGEGESRGLAKAKSRIDLEAPRFAIPGGDAIRCSWGNAWTGLKFDFALEAFLNFNAPTHGNVELGSSWRNLQSGWRDGQDVVTGIKQPSKLVFPHTTGVLDQGPAPDNVAV